MSSAETSLFITFWAMVAVSTGFALAGAVRGSGRCFLVSLGLLAVAFVIMLIIRGAVDA